MSVWTWFRELRAAQLHQAVTQVFAALEDVPLPAYELRKATGLRMIWVYRAVDHLMWDGDVVDEWRDDPEHPDRPARRFYRKVSR